MYVIVYHQDFFFLLEAISIKLISCKHNNGLATHFNIVKINKLLA